jgi:hypothetical protein
LWIVLFVVDIVDTPVVVVVVVVVERRMGN